MNISNISIRPVIGGGESALKGFADIEFDEIMTVRSFPIFANKKNGILFARVPTTVGKNNKRYPCIDITDEDFMKDLNDKVVEAFSSDNPF